MPNRPCALVVSSLLLLALTGPLSAATIVGTPADDVVEGGPGDDRLYGARGEDRLAGGQGDDQLYGGRGNDRAHGGRGNDRLYGEEGNDLLDGGRGYDRLFGGSGNDVIVARDGGRDLISCGGGHDLVVADRFDRVSRDCETVNPTAQTLRLSVSVTSGGTVTSSPAGINCGSDCSEDYASGTTVTLVATPAGGSSFAGWSGACTGTGVCVVVMDAAKSAQADFAPTTQSPTPTAEAATPAGEAATSAPQSPPPVATFRLDVSVVGLGAVTSSPGGISCGSDCSEDYGSGTTVTLTAVPDGPLGIFVGWTGACSGTGACTVTMDADRAVGALFAA